MSARLRFTNETRLFKRWRHIKSQAARFLLEPALLAFGSISAPANTLYFGQVFMDSKNPGQLINVAFNFGFRIGVRVYGHILGESGDWQTWCLQPRHPYHWRRVRRLRRQHRQNLADVKKTGTRSKESAFGCGFAAAFRLLPSSTPVSCGPGRGHDFLQMQKIGWQPAVLIAATAPPAHLAGIPFSMVAFPRGLDMPAGDITGLLDRWTHGDPDAVEALTPLVYSHLRKLATSYLRRERSDHTLQATGLVNELFLVLMDEKRAKFEDRVHFYTFAARAMRRILVNHARNRQTAKRGAGETHMELSPDLAWIDPEGPEMIDLDRALGELETTDPRKAKVVDLRIFLGCTAEEAAELIGVSKPTLDRDLRFALAWLYKRMKHPA